MSFQFFGGVDFSGAKEPLANLWTAVGRESNGKLEILSLLPHAFRLDLVSFVSRGWRSTVDADDEQTILWGVDFPLGLPRPAAEHLLGGSASWDRLLPWIADRPPDEIRGAAPPALHTPRSTDAGAGPGPFDIRLYKQAMEGIRWAHELREECEVSVLPQDPRDAPVTMIEVSPSATTQEVGLPRRRAPGRPGEVRARAAALRTFMHFRDPASETIAVTLEDPWDAAIACLTAFLARNDLDQPFRVSRHPRETLEIEGWIYRAPDTLK